MGKKAAAFFILTMIAFIARAHEFWMQPDKFFYKAGELLNLSFKVGENFTGEAVDFKTNRIEKIELHHLQQATDLRGQVKEGEKANLEIPLTQEGTHLVVMESNNAFISLDGEKFNAYLKEDGLDDIYFQREKTKTLGDSSRELYSRHTKLLVQVGTKTDDTYKKVIGLPLEIIPGKNPYALKVGDPIRFKILFNGKPLFGAKVKVWNRYGTQVALQNIYSQQDGMIDATISHAGTWMVSVVAMVKSKDPKAEWQSYWGSLVFGIK
jgi:uncharacterized GH25 family protein